jgi:Flp pilus assembly protein TadG
MKAMMVTINKNARASTRICGPRRGAISVLVIILLMIMLTMAVFAIDYGYLLVVRTDLQRAADNAALSAVQDLIPDANGNQDVDAAKATVRAYAAANLVDENFSVADEDIEIGRYDPDTVYSDFTIVSDGIYDTVRVTLRRDDLNNSSVTLMLARFVGVQTADISATSTAVLQKARFLEPGSDLLPIAIPQATWNAQQPGDEWSVYGSGRLVDENGNEVPGNWGTLDVGNTSNSTADLVNQINNGLRQEDLDALEQAGTISNSQQIDSQQSMWLNGDTGFSAGIKSAVIASHGKTKLIPIFDSMNGGNGGNLDYHVVGWGVVEIVSSSWQGNKKSSIVIRKTYSYDGDLRAHPDLSNTTDIIEAAYTSPVLVE